MLMCLIEARPLIGPFLWERSVICIAKCLSKLHGRPLLAGALAAAAASGIPRCEYDVLDQKLQGLMTDGRKLYLTGHSIGAGLAAIFAQALHARCASAVSLDGPVRPVLIILS